MRHKPNKTLVTHRVFEDTIVQLAALCPICALAALSPAAALSALSPVLRIFNPAINPAAALLAFATPQAGVNARVRVRMARAMARIKAR